MNVVDVLIPFGHPNRPGFAIAPRGVVWHRTGRDVGAIWLGRYFGRDASGFDPLTWRYGSSHYGVDEEHVARFIPEDEGAYHVGPRREILHLLPMNANRNGLDLGVELCQYFDDPPRIRPRTYANAVGLATDLCRRYRWSGPHERDELGIQRFTRHSDWDPVDRPHDPGDFLRWDEFLGDVDRAVAGEPWIPKEEDLMTKDERKAEFLEFMAEEITPTIVAMKTAYDPLVAAARANGQLDAAQEAAIDNLEARIDKLRDI